MIKIKKGETDYVCERINEKFGNGSKTLDKEKYFEDVDTIHVTQPDIEIVNESIMSWIEQLRKYNKKARRYDEGVLDDSQRKEVSL